MDCYQRFMITGKCGFPLASSSSSYIDSAVAGGGSSEIIVEVSFDQFVFFLQSNRFSNYKMPIHFKVYDEAIVRTREECMLRFQFLKYLNQFKNGTFDFYLSDSSLPAYISFMNSIPWKHDNMTTYRMSMDRNPLNKKNIPLESARGIINIPEEKLIWFPDETLKLLPGKIGSLCFHDTLKLKKIIHDFMNQVDHKYQLSYMNDFDKAYLVYHYLFDCRAFNNIDITPRTITYAVKQTVKDRNGVQRLKPSLSRWESRPVGTFERGKGVCSGQSRLFSALLCNPEMNVKADSVYGVIPSGEVHCWSNFVIHDKIYQCCTTMKGLFTNLDYFGYKPYSDQIFTQLYPHSSLTFPQLEKVKQHLKSIRK